jgi:hypothetical protein
MPIPAAAGIPAIISVLGRFAPWGLRAWAGYEAVKTGADVIETALDFDLKEVEALKKKVEKEIDEAIESLQGEIDENIRTFAAVDPGGNSTVSRQAGEGATFKEYIERKIPFRPAISLICKLALEHPITVPRLIRNILKRKTRKDLTESDYVQAELRQITASILFVIIDETLKWQSPLKAEPNYKPSGEPYLGSPPTRVARIVKFDYAFWPRPRGVLSPDLVIVEYRQKPWTVDNVFAAVEIKFPRDWVRNEQLNDYSKVMKNKNKIALLRVPEDCVGMPQKSKGGKTKTGGKTI